MTDMRDHEGNVVVVIEYIRDQPHSVTVESKKPSYGLTYDFERCPVHGMVYRWSGGGPVSPYFLSGWIEPPRNDLWTAEHITFTRWEGKDCHGHEVPADDAMIRAKGYDLIPVPHGNPFDDARDRHDLNCTGRCRPRRISK